MTFCRLIGILPLLSLACSATPTPVPTKNLDRPKDMAFLCLGLVDQAGTAPAVLTGLPLSSCQPESEKRPIPIVNDERKLGTYSLIIEEGRNDFMVADLDKNRLVDLSPTTAGYGAVPVVGDPHTVQVSSDGCQAAVTAQTECGLLVIDPARLLSSSFLPTKSHPTPSTGEGPPTKQMTIRTKAGTLLDSKIGEIAYLPSVTKGGVCAPETVSRMVVTLPSCGLVGIVELSPGSESATLLNAIRLDATGGVERLNGDVTCPSECATVTPEDASRFPNLYRPTALALLPDGSQGIVSSIDSPTLFEFPISDFELGEPRVLTLSEGAAGVSRLRISIDPNKTTRIPQEEGAEQIVQGRLLEGRSVFLYAFALDGSLRVVDLGQWVECDVNAQVIESRDQACFPVGSVVRRPLALGPGLEIPTSSNVNQPPPLIRDIAFVDLSPPVDETLNPQALRGQYAFLLTSNNAVYILNLSPADEPLTVTNSFREYREVGSSQRTPLSLTLLPQRFSSVSDRPFAVSKNFSVDHAPNLERFEVEGTEQYVQLPAPDHLVSQKWDVVWEGAIPRGSRTTGSLLASASEASAGTLVDRGGAFCTLGVHPGDILYLPGCGQDSDCRPESDFYCELSVTTAHGLCLPRTNTRVDKDDLLSECRRLLGSRMRYEVKRSTNAQLELGLLLDEVPKTSLNTCESDLDCQVDTDHSLFSCLPDPLGGSRKRCLQPCTLQEDFKGDAECRLGNVCAPITADPDRGFCVEAPPIRQECWQQPLHAYQLFAGKSYLIRGNALSQFRTMGIAEDSSCQDLERDISLQDRIPLSAPACPQEFLEKRTAPTGETIPIQGLEPEVGFNPCLYRSSDSATSPIYAYFQNPQLRFVLKNVDNYVADLYALHFEFRYGFQPLTVSSNYEILLTSGIRILTGPMRTPESPIEQNPPTSTTYYPYLYVIDQGRTMATSASRGQIVRINPRSGSNAVPSFDLATTGKTPFQLQ